VLIHGVFRSKENEDLFVVFDGHGGKDCAEYAARNIPKKLAESLENNVEPLAAFANIFQEIHKEIAGW
jgi:serine/threonine protein phosphatase PrpC